MSSTKPAAKPWPNYDFEITVRPPGLQGSTPRKALEDFLSTLPGVRRHGPEGFVLDSPISLWMEITPETRRWDGFIGTRVDAVDNTVNCVRLFFPGTRRGPEIERAYWRTAFAIADHLGWDAWDDTYSNCFLSPEMVERQLREYAGETGKPGKPWWKLW